MQNQLHQNGMTAPTHHTLIPAPTITPCSSFTRGGTVGSEILPGEGKKSLLHFPGRLSRGPVSVLPEAKQNRKGQQVGDHREPKPWFGPVACHHSFSSPSSAQKKPKKTPAPLLPEGERVELHVPIFFEELPVSTVSNVQTGPGLL